MGSMSHIASQSAASYRVPSNRFVAEICLWCKWRYSGSLRSETRASLNVLTVSDFASSVHQYPNILSLATYFANEFTVACRRDRTHVSDLFGFSQMRQVLLSPHTEGMRAGSRVDERPSLNRQSTCSDASAS